MRAHPGRKKICFVATLPITLLTFVRPQADRLVRSGWEVTWVCSADDKLVSTFPIGISHVPVTFKRGINLLGVLTATVQLTELFRREQFDIVQYSTPNAALCASTAAWLSAVPIRLYAQWGIRYVGFGGILRFFFKQLERWCCRCSTIIEPDSVGNLQFSVDEGLYAKGKARVIWNGSASGVDLVRFDIRQRDSWGLAYRSKLGINANHLVVGFVGSIRRDKGCNELLSACRSIFPMIPEARLLLIGDKTFYASINQDLRDWVEDAKQVITVPPNSEIPQYMSCMDVFALPSYREGFGSVIVEAEAMGIPVVVSDVPGPIDAMRPGVTGVVVPVKNVTALAAALHELLTDPARRKLLGANAVAFARDNFEQTEYFRHVLEDKERLLAAPQAEL